MHLADLNESIKVARRNVLKALESEDVPIFIGAEHLLPLSELWSDERHLILIERAPERLKLILQEFDVEPLEHFNLVVGEGIYECLVLWERWKVAIQEEVFTNAMVAYIFSEISLISLRLNQLPDELFLKNQIFYLSPNQILERNFHHYLNHAIHMVIFAKRFHHQNHEKYLMIKNSTSCGLAYLCLDENDQEVIKTKFKNLQKEESDRFLCLYNKKTLNLFSHGLMSHQHCFSPESEKYFALFKEIATRLIRFVCETKPISFVCRNRSPIINLEDRLFLQESLERIGIKTQNIFMDVFNQMNVCFEGGALYHFLNDFSDHNLHELYCPNPALARIYGPEKISKYTVAHQYLNEADQILAPVNSPANCFNEIAILHSARLDHITYPPINELFALVRENSNHDSGKAVTRYLFQLRSIFSGSYYFQSLINNLDWCFYSLVRLDRTHAIIHKNPGLKIKVYGDPGWLKIIEEKYYGGYLQGEEQIAEAYQKSVVTVSTSLNWSFKSPHPSGVNCFRLGGFPLMAYPSLEDDEKLGCDFFNQDTFVFYQDVDDCLKKVQIYLDNFKLRNELIVQAQQTWIAQMKQSDYYKNFMNNESTLIESGIPHKFEKDFCLDQHQSKLLLDIGKAYLYFLSGYFSSALEIWMRVLKSESDIKFCRLPERAFKVAQFLGDEESVKYLMKKSA